MVMFAFTGSMHGLDLRIDRLTCSTCGVSFSAHCEPKDKKEEEEEEEKVKFQLDRISCSGTFVRQAHKSIKQIFASHRIAFARLGSIGRSARLEMNLANLSLTRWNRDGE
jgi:hypothetical protein